MIRTISDMTRTNVDRLTPLPGVRVNRLLVLLRVLEVRRVVRDGLDLLGGRDLAALGELGVVRHVLAAVAGHAAGVLAGALVAPLHEGEIVLTDMIIVNAQSGK